MNRPKLKIKKSGFDIGIETLTFLFIFVSVILIIKFYNQLPEKLPIYFNWPSKDINGFAPKSSLWVSPIISGLLCVGIFILNKYPWLFNYPSNLKPENAALHYKMATRMMRVIGLVIGLSCLVLTYFSILAGFNNLNGLDRYLFPTLPILIFAPLVYYLIKSYRISKHLKT